MDMANRFYGEFDCEHLTDKPRESDYRSAFQVDRDRVLFSNAFRSLQSKTQVFKSGDYDFYRTRLTHTIEVARIARSIAEFLNATSERMRSDFHLDPDLIEAIGLAHDLGHPPFGHIGERKLNELMRDQGGFEGNAQTLRILTQLIYTRPRHPKGMNPTRAFLDGVLKYKCLYSERRRSVEGQLVYPHHHFLYDDQATLRDFVFGSKDVMPPVEHLDLCKSIECQIMDWADDTAYSIHDIVDGANARFITPDRLLSWGDAQDDLSSHQQDALDKLVEEMRKGGLEPQAGIRVGEFIRACSLGVRESPLSGRSNRHRFELRIDPRFHEICQLHKRIAIDLIFRSAPLQEIEFKGGRMLERLFGVYVEHGLGRNSRSLQIIPDPYAGWLRHAGSEQDRLRLICDMLSSMTDGQAIRVYRRLFEPEFGSLIDFY